LAASAPAQAADPSKAIGLTPKPAVKAPVAPLGVDVEHNAARFVGVNEFDPDKGIRALHFAVNDAIAQAHLFVLELKLIPPENCILALSGKPEGAESTQQLVELDKAKVQTMRADRSMLIKALLQVRGIARAPSDMIIVSFSTHGFSGINESYVMPSDGQRAALSLTALAYSSIEDLLHPSKAGKILLLLDACREQPSDDGSKGVDGAMSKAFMRALKSSEGKFVLASCGEGQYSYENAQLGHGVFTHFLLDGLRGQALADRNGFITLGSVSSYVTNAVEDWVARNRPDAGGPVQVPWYKGDGTATNIPLAIDPGVRAEAEAFKTLVNKLKKDLTTKIDSSFTGEMYDQLARKLSKTQYDEAGKDLIANLQAFVNGSLGEEPFLAYVRDVLRDRPAPVANNPLDPTPGPAPSPDSLEALLGRSDAGDGAAQYKLALMYAKGNGVDQDDHKAALYYRKAADSGIVEAMTEVGRRYLQDYSAGIDYVNAFQWFQKAADGGSPLAMFYLGYQCETGRGTVRNTDNANSWYAKAEPLLFDASGGGDPEILNALGMILIRGSGVAANVPEGLKLVKKAALLGSVNAMLNLGMLYDSGAGGLPQDEHEAFVQYTKAAQLKSPTGMVHVGQRFAAGRGVQRSASDAVKWFATAADMGHPLAAYYAGQVYELGLGVAKDEQEANRWFAKAISPLKKAAERGDSESAMFDLAQCYAGGWGVDKNATMALDWFIKAANRGHAKAAARLGWMYGNGEGVGKNDAEALSWYRKAAALGDADAIAWLAHQAQ
jgi:TPR repeat protein